jgi:broad specificity phosphatase PhoE
MQTKWPRFERRRALLAAPLVLAPVLAVAWGLRRRVPTTLVVVRHADRAGSEDALSAAGRQRAEALAHALGAERLAAIYTSDTRRARDTAAPLARVLGLTPRVRPARDTSSLVSEIFSEHRGKRVLVVGHGNTVPQIIAAAGGPALPDLPENEFDHLFVMTGGVPWGRTELVHLRYGEGPGATG